MLNGFGTCHGGVLYTLADTALSCACNSRNERSVAQHCSIVYLRPGRLGERLTANAIERSSAGRVGIYDVKLTDSSGEVIAEFFGHARLIGGAVDRRSDWPSQRSGQIARRQTQNKQSGGATWPTASIGIAQKRRVLGRNGKRKSWSTFRSSCATSMRRCPSIAITTTSTGSARIK